MNKTRERTVMLLTQSATEHSRLYHIYIQVRGGQRGCSLAVTEAKIQVWEEFRKVVHQGF